ncbi:hypothetical protein GCM10028806_30350 [Spirosoma terrae]|uniref:Uncharacterized protein n=1 Tax=Spirosoma terrae TaxID=1968276 RepID=A0A6L9LF93_9BACT|nr:hypothetical protein [Spirosoma terrae]NDU95349.1 hypothetical protein [Spirosoma terrae]
MKSATSLFLGILLFVGSLFPQTDVEEVFKLPYLLAHYQTHKLTASADFTFWQFLDMHYNASSRHAKQPHEGVKIPLYNHLSTGFIFTLTQPQPRHIPSMLEELIPWPQVNFAYENLYSYQTISFLFQPPQRG